MHRVAAGVACLVLFASFGGGTPARAATDPLAPRGIGTPPAPPPIRPVTETLFGTRVTDNYRYMEALDAQTLDWMRAQGAYTRRVLDAIAPLDALRRRVSAFTGSFGMIEDYAREGGRAFYQERRPGADAFSVMVQDSRGTRALVDIDAWRKAHGGQPFAINYLMPSPDGTKAAIGISEGGSEAADLYIFDAASGATLAGPIDRAQFGPTGWSNDSRTLYFIRLKPLGPNDPGTEKYRDAALDAWAAPAAPVPLYGAGRDGPRIGADETPSLSMAPGAPRAILTSVNGVQPELRIWTAPVAEAEHPKAGWTLLADRADGVTGLDLRGDEIFLLSHKDAPTFKVLSVRARAPLGTAATLVPASADRVIEGVHAASDALYVLARAGAYSQLLRIPAGTGRVERVALPAPGHVSEVFTDPREAGLTLSLENWVTPPRTLRYDPATKRFTDLHLGAAGDIDAADFTVEDLQARAKDGAQVPLSLVRKKGAAAKHGGPQVTVIEAYGAYGISELADFSTRRAVMMREGISYGICHVRGGGELGEAWRLGGKDANKHNTWDDLIACGEDLIARGVTSKGKLFILGGSAGGITMGRAMTERPDLFAGVIDLVPAANTLRAEFSPNGPDNVPEFGTIGTEAGFRNLLAMDSIQHVRKGVDYPAVLISTGLNDPRVSPWEPAKFAAALEAAGGPNPVLLRIDTQAGHGIGSTRTQTDALAADWIAFCFWRAGVPGWRPEASR